MLFFLGQGGGGGGGVCPIKFQSVGFSKKLSVIRLFHFQNFNKNSAYQQLICMKLPHSFNILVYVDKNYELQTCLSWYFLDSINI